MASRQETDGLAGTEGPGTLPPSTLPSCLQSYPVTAHMPCWAPGLPESSHVDTKLISMDAHLGDGELQSGGVLLTVF